ncbi:hypothetical protein E2C01_094361 [Portunus trituberculatus]|uniref:Uncharacterized protein n=1 Tax=Portunus trituberculatus TaxID=210409 RepID=A0A5B7JVY0_PORTR|nr:hypothetical protein [Portunus trituberculatus]
MPAKLGGGEGKNGSSNWCLKFPGIVNTCSLFHVYGCRTFANYREGKRRKGEKEIKRHAHYLSPAAGVALPCRPLLP